MIYFLYLPDREGNRCRVWKQKENKMCPDAKVKINSTKREKLKKAIFFVIELSLDPPCFYDILQIIEDTRTLP